MEARKTKFKMPEDAVFAEVPIDSLFDHLHGRSRQQGLSGLL
jgi:hypothetical protein